MDAGLGKLEPISEKVAYEIFKGQEITGSTIPSVFRVGEMLHIKASRFRIQSIGRSKMKLKLLKPEE